jgi:hypothetical protein
MAFDVSNPSVKRTNNQANKDRGHGNGYLSF